MVSTGDKELDKKISDWLSWDKVLKFKRIARLVN